MPCKDVRASLPGGAGAEALPPELAEHLAGCAECRAEQDRQARLDALLDADAGLEPRPGFDTRFFARLEEVKARRQEPTAGTAGWWRWLMAGVPLAAAATVLALTIMPAPEPTLEDDLALAMELELIEDLEVVRSLDELEAFEVLARVEPEEIDDAGEGVPQ